MENKLFSLTCHAKFIALTPGWKNCCCTYFNHVPELRISLEHILNVFRSQIFIVQSDQNGERDLVGFVEDL